jgi:hypothetical protein
MTIRIPRAVLIAVPVILVLGAIAAAILIFAAGDDGGGKKRVASKEVPILNTAQTEAQITARVERLSKARVRPAQCPAEVEIRAGAVFYCEVALASGPSARVRVRQEDAAGRVRFRFDGERDGRVDCNILGINQKGGREGPCSLKGQRFVVSDKDGKLKLDELAARLGGWEVTKTISGQYDRATANDMFVVFTLEITSRLSEPQRYETQPELHVGSKAYTTDTASMNLALDNAFGGLGSDLDVIQPGSTQTGRVAFDIPEKVANTLSHSEGAANLDVFNFSDIHRKGASQIGIFRLYK